MRQRIDPRVKHPDRPPPIPLEYAGMWVATNGQRKVLGAGWTLEEAEQAARAAGHEAFIIGRGPAKELRRFLTVKDGAA